MERLRVKIHPLFFIYVFVCIYFGWINLIFYYIVVMFLHEWAHYIVAKKLGYRVDGFLLSVYGIGMQSRNLYKRKDEIFIALAGPVLNLMLIILTVFFWWVFPSSYYFTYDFFISNLMILLFNIIPLYPLDGGRVVACLFRQRKKIIIVSNLVSFVIGIIFICLFIVSFFYQININLLFIGMFLSINSICCDKNDYFLKISSLNKNYDKPIEIKRFCVQTKDKLKLLKYLSPHYYSVFEVDENGKKIEIREDDLLN